MASIPARRNVAFAPIAPPSRWLPILDQYILREMWPPLVYGFGAFLLFWFINIFFVAADYIINKGERRCLRYAKEQEAQHEKKRRAFIDDVIGRDEKDVDEPEEQERAETVHEGRPHLA